MQQSVLFSQAGIRLTELLFLGLLLLTLLAPVDAAAAKLVRVGVYDNKPLVFKNVQGRYEGLAIDVLQAVAADEGWSLQFVEGSWPESLHRLEAGTIDLLVAIAPTEERRELFDFNTIPLISNWARLYSAPRVTLESLLDLNGRKIGLLRDDIHTEAFTALIADFGIMADVSYFNSYDAVLSAVKQNQVDAGLLNRLYSKRRARHYRVNDTPIVFNPIKVHYAVAKNRNASLIVSIDNHLQRFKADKDSVYYQSLSRWVESPEETGLSREELIVGVVLLFGLIALLGFVMLLRWQVRSRTRQLRHEMAQGQVVRDHLMQQKTLFREIFNHMSSGVVIYEAVDAGSDFMIRDINPAGERICRLEKDKMVGQNVCSVFPGVKEMGLFKVLQRVFQTGHPEEYPVSSYQDQRLKVSVENYVCKLLSGEVVAIFNDVTEQKRQQDDLKESLALYATLFNANRMIILLIDPETSQLVDANPAACKFYGYSHTELQQLRVGDINILDESQTRVKMQQVLRDGSGVFQFRHRLKSGEICDVEVHSSVLVLDDRTLLCSIINDISRRVEMERRLVLARDEWTSTFDAIPDMIVMLDLEQRIIRVNRAVCNFLNKDFNDLLGKQYQNIFGCNLPVCPVSELQKGAKSHSQTFTMPSSNQTFELTCAPILNDQGKMENLVNIIKDITGQKQLEEQLVQAQKMEAVGTLAGGVAHDFNNILSAIIGFSEIAKLELPAGSKAAADIDEAIKASKRATELVKQILTFSRKDGAATQLLQPHLIVKESLKMLRSSLPTTVVIEEAINPDCGFVNASPTRLHQLMMNLCTNAVHAMPNEKGTLSIGLQRQTLSAEQVIEPDQEPGDYVVLTVADNGCGMEPRIIERIFEPYFTTKEVDRGTGLGLAVVHGIVQDCQGFIRLKSTLGQGSKFDVYLPASAITEGTLLPLGERRRLPRGSEHILVVDDEESVATINRALLEKLGYRVSTELGSGRALELFRADPDGIDLLLTDQTMPELTGMELAREFLALRPDLPVILCTGYSSQVNEQDAMAAGIRAFLMKPVAMQELALKVRALLDSQ